MMRMIVGLMIRQKDLNGCVGVSLQLWPDSCSAHTYNSHNVLITQICQLDSASVVYVSGGPAGGPSQSPSPDQQHEIQKHILSHIRRINCKRSPEYLMNKEDTSFTEHFMCMKNEDSSHHT